MNPFENIEPPNDVNWYRNVTLLAISSTISTLATHPIDVIRVQMQSQLAYISPRQVLRQIVKYRGFIGVYYGFITGLQREFTYCWLRFALYEHAKNRGVIDNFWRKIQYASASGFFGGFISTPLTKIAMRIRADAAKPPTLRYNYKHVFHGLRELYSEGGFSSYYNMARTCGVRGMFTTVWQLVVYDYVREMLLNQEIEFQQVERYLVSSAIAGIITIIIITPVDVVEQIGSTLHSIHFPGEWNIIRQISHLHGVRGFYRGLLPNIGKVFTQALITIIFYEVLNPHIPKLS